jgi:hypothetical protein
MAIFRECNQIQTLIDLERRKFGLVGGIGGSLRGGEPPG